MPVESTPEEDMDAMAMDTAGFNKLLAKHAQEEEKKGNADKKVLDASEAEAKYQGDLKKKNKELLDLMKQIESDKPQEGWGFTKKNADGADKKEEFDLYKDNL